MKTIIAILAVAIMLSCSQKTEQITLLDKANFETTVDGKEVSLYTLRGGDLVMQVTNYGARVISLWVPDRNGNYADVEIGSENIDRYINNTGERFLGAVDNAFRRQIFKAFHAVLRALLAGYRMRRVKAFIQGNHGKHIQIRRLYTDSHFFKHCNCIISRKF